MKWLIDIIKKYRIIATKLKDLENGRIYELSRSQMDGYLATNIGQLRKMFSELVSKIVDNKDSTNVMLSELFNQK